MVNSASHVTTLIQSLSLECAPAFQVLQLTNINLLQKETFHLAMPQAIQHKHEAFRLYYSHDIYLLEKLYLTTKFRVYGMNSINVNERRPAAKINKVINLAILNALSIRLYDDHFEFS